jgi:AAA domain-containing protein/uncharacterized protein DUF3854
MLRGASENSIRSAADENIGQLSGRLENALRESLHCRHYRRMLLEESGISAAVAMERGYYAATTEVELARLGFSKPQRRAPALVIPMYSPNGELITHQIRPDAPRKNDKGKPIKYETPAGSPVHLDVHPSQTERVRDASVPLWITEGVKKADSLVSRGHCAVALQGVWCWQKDGVSLHEWEDVRLWGRPVCVIFDSDVMTNPKVQAALDGLVGFLRGRGARVRVAYLPDAPGGGKQGIDDFLASGRGLRDLEPFVQEGLREDLLPAGRLLSEVEPERVSWLWPRRIPRGKVAVLDGDPDNGKSVLTTDLAARVTAGLDLPDGTPTETAGVVIVSAEDGANDTIRPRFDAAGGDPTRARLLGDEEPFAIPDDIPRLERAVRQVGAALVVIDPIMAFLSGDVNSNRDQDVRRALTPLKQMAERTGAAVVLVRHLNKTPGGNPLYRGGGSIGIIGAARSGMVVGRHPDDEEMRVLAGQKNNLSLPPESLAYRIETADNGAARIVYEGVSEATAGQLLRVPADEEEKSALTEAKEFLLSELRPRPMSAKQVKKNAEEADVAYRTLKRAKQALGVRSEKESDGSWTWSLPDKATEGGQSSTAGTLGTVGPLGKDASLKADDPAYLREEGQEGQEVQGDHRPRCIHGFRDGTGCYLCDSRHPYRLQQ